MVDPETIDLAVVASTCLRVVDCAPDGLAVCKGTPGGLICAKGSPGCLNGTAEGAPGGLTGTEETPGGLKRVEDTPGGFSGVLSLIAARPCATPDIGVVGRPPERVAGTCGPFVGVLGGPRESLAGLCGRTNPEVVAGLFVGLCGRPVYEGVLAGPPGRVAD